jgi:hypothetical protein
VEASCQFYIAGDKLGFNTFDSFLLNLPGWKRGGPGNVPQHSGRFALDQSRPRPSLMRNARTIGLVRENKTMLDRVQITRLDESIPRWQIRDIKVSTSQLRYALRASEEQIKEAVDLKPGQQMTIDLYP